MVVAFSLANLLVEKSSFIYPEEWLNKMISECNRGKPELQSHEILADAAFVKTGLVSAIFGAYFGTIIDSIYLGGTKKDINRTPVWKNLT